MAGAVDLRARGLDRVLEHLLERDRPAAELELAGGDARHVEKVVHQPHEMAELAADDLPGARGVLPAAVHLERVPHRGQRVPELVGEHGQELPLALVHLAQGLLAAGPLRLREVAGQEGAGEVAGGLRDHHREGDDEHEGHDRGGEAVVDPARLHRAGEGHRGGEGKDDGRDHEAAGHGAGLVAADEQGDQAVIGAREGHAAGQQQEGDRGDERDAGRAGDRVERADAGRVPDGAQEGDEEHRERGRLPDALPGPAAGVEDEQGEADERERDAGRGARPVGADGGQRARGFR